MSKLRVLLIKIAFHRVTVQFKLGLATEGQLRSPWYWDGGSLPGCLARLVLPDPGMSSEDQKRPPPQRQASLRGTISIMPSDVRTWAEQLNNSANCQLCGPRSCVAEIKGRKPGCRWHCSTGRHASVCHSPGKEGRNQVRHLGSPHQPAPGAFKHVPANEGVFKTHGCQWAHVWR